jgi:hypothetical protein
VSVFDWFRSYAWRSRDKVVAKTAVDETDDFPLLWRIMEDRRANPIARAEAVKKVLEMTEDFRGLLLPRNAKENIRISAIRQITDQAMLIELAKRGAREYRQAAAERIKDPSVRADLEMKIATAGLSWFVPPSPEQKIAYERGMAALERNRLERERLELQIKSQKIEQHPAAEIKDMIRNTKGARDFIAAANRAGFATIGQDASGLFLKRGDHILGIVVLPSRGPDSIWTLSITTGKELINLIDEGKITF